MTVIYDRGVPREATPEEKATPTDSVSRYTGCNVFVISKGFKHWCRNGAEPHEGHFST